MPILDMKENKYRVIFDEEDGNFIVEQIYIKNKVVVTLGKVTGLRSGGATNLFF